MRFAIRPGARGPGPELPAPGGARSRAALGGIAVAAAVVVAAVIWYSTRPPPPVPDRLTLTRTAFADLDGWRADPHAAALVPFLLSCTRLSRLAEERSLGPDGIGGTVADWRAVCAAAAGLPSGDDAAARSFFEAHFVPLAATNGGQVQGLFTGYYEPQLRGSRARQGRYAFPIYRPPPDLVRVNLGEFRDSLKGQRIAGRAVDGKLEPFPDRGAIDAGALDGRGLELVWVDDPIDAFFLHIQGSGRVALDDGTTLRVGYAAQNGHPYFAIGRELVARGALEPETVSLQTIRAWLRSNDEGAADVMALNRSYVFFDELDGAGPIGAQGAVLTPRRSLAVDRRYLPLGAPMWLEASAPASEEGAPDMPLHRLLIAQDTGGAIRGPVRGDVFWGHGAAAEAIAGRMKHSGRYYLLLPTAVANRLEETGRLGCAD